ncbi:MULTISPECIES: oligosaccharyl transferase, archaeosortase A system-associated [Salinibaculum]|uniref:oligosaccharyl transferase, archaeosortase A system-associated n=1 Tax=Salinibaculum TaxID=2732368 RepID=UPI0030CD4AD5
MSNWREQFEDGSGAHAFTAWLGQYYHYLTLVFLVAFAFWNRARKWGNFVIDGEVLFRSNDPWYHYRSTKYVVEHFPETMPFDAWTYFSFGTSQSQFGTIFDQILATIALIVGLGNPSDHTVRLVVLFGPALFGTAIIVPAYFIGRRLGGRFAGVIAAGVIALAPDGLLARSVVGFSDHQVAEALFQGIAVLGVLVALYVAQRERPVYELVADREFEAIRRPLGWSILAGVGIGAYLWVWPPGVLLLGILGVFFVIHLSIQAVKGESPEHTALVGFVSLTTAGLLQLSTVNTLEISATSRSLLQPGLAFAVAAGCLFMAWFFRQWEARDLSRYGYPGAIALILVASAAFTALVLPDIFSYFVNQVLRVVGFQTSPTAGTVGEAQPLENPQALFSWYRLAIFTAIAGVGIVLYRQYTRDHPAAGELLVAILFVFMLAATFTQSRFSYYLAIPVAALTALTVGTVMQYVGRVDDFLQVEAYQVMVVFAVLLVTIAPLAWGGPAMIAADNRAQPGGVVGWNDGLDFLSDNTPVEGQYANPDGEPMELYGVFDRTDDYNYSAGDYGVMSWWDYGHWITAQGERIPNANPFQQGAGDAALYLTSQNETAANDVLADIDEEDAKTRYVMIDWKMAETETGVNGKFFAPARFNPDTIRSDFYSRVASVAENGGLQTRGIWQKQPYYNSTLTRLYRYHGSAMEPAPVVTDWQGAERQLSSVSTFVEPPQDGQIVKFFDNVSAARQYVEEDGTAQLGGIGPYPSERVPAMEHYRLVHMSQFSGMQGRLSQVLTRDVLGTGLVQQFAQGNTSGSQAFASAANFLYPNTPSWVKTFEKVPGATIEGTGPANTTLTLQVDMSPQTGGVMTLPQGRTNVPGLANGNFTYTQQVQTGADGEFTATVPYSTTGYDELGPEEGYTNTTVRATGPYRITGPTSVNGTEILQYRDTVNVTEAQVLGVDDDPVTATVEEQVVGNFDSGGSSDGGSAGDSTDDGQSSSDGSGNDTSNSLGTDVALDPSSRLVSP